MRGLAIGRRPGQRQHVEIELAGRVLPAVLRKAALGLAVLRQRDDGEKEQEAQGNGGGLRHPANAMTKQIAKHWTPPSQGHRNKP
jgi:hypothetical protein